ncbi:Putidaredoxin reductase CamA [Burkholderiales bacterium 8X]|nr:Putidaredoxin reductase CamA [Burkholderiales bacterium 8X]
MNDSIVIIGAGHAAGELAVALRQGKPGCRITLIGEEVWLPYQRPPLSKTWLSQADAAEESLLLRPPATYAAADVRFLSSTRAMAIDRVRRRIDLSSGETLHYDGLALATGARVRRLVAPQAEQAEGSGNFHYLRTIDDVKRLRPQFRAGARIAIVGGGYVGLEVASAAIKHGLKVTVLEAHARVLARVTAPEVSAFYEDVHRAAGVDLRCNVALAGFDFAPGGDRVAAVRCRAHDGRDFAVEVDLVVVGIGVVPNTELAQAAGLPIDNGIVVDEFARTADSAIVAAGDCTSHPNPVADGLIRLESVPNAVEQARTAAATLCGQQRPHRAVPWFWSDQYDLKLQMVGLSRGYDRLVLRGSMAGRSFAAFYLKDGRVVAADMVNRPKDFMLAKRIVAGRMHADESALADESFDLKSLAPAPAAQV